MAPAAARDAPISCLPPEAPLAMPVQSLRQGRARSASIAPAAIAARRAFVFGVALALSVIAAYEMYLVLAVGGLTALEAVILGLFVILFAWIALSFASMLGGLIALATGRIPLDIGPAHCRRSRRALRCCCRPTTRSRTACSRGVQAICELVAATGKVGPFRRLHPQRHDRSGHLDRRGGSLPRLARAR